LVQVVDGWTNSLHEAWNKLATPEQTKAAGPVPMIWTRLDWINAVTMHGLIAVGACLLLGLFTPLAALGGAAYLAMFYLSMPPWPGLPQGPMSEGHYLFVNKNLIELIACLVLAKVPTAHWIGLDPFLFGWTWRRQGTAPTKKPAPEKRRASPQPPIPDIFIRSDR